MTSCLHSSHMQTCNRRGDDTQLITHWFEFELSTRILKYLKISQNKMSICLLMWHLDRTFSETRISRWWSRSSLTNKNVSTSSVQQSLVVHHIWVITIVVIASGRNHRRGCHIPENGARNDTWRRLKIRTDRLSPPERKCLFSALYMSRSVRTCATLRSSKVENWTEYHGSLFFKKIKGWLMTI